MKLERKKPLPIEGIQFDGTQKSVVEIMRLQESFLTMTKVIRFENGHLYLKSGSVAKIGDWVVNENNVISVYPSDKFEILFRRKSPNFAVPTLSDIA